VPLAEIPLDNGAGMNWQKLFAKVGWNITLLISDRNVEEPSGESWNRAEAHAAMLARREKSNLDVEWRYHVLAVRKIDKVSAATAPTPFDRENGERGHMYDDISFGSNTVRREGLMVASHWLFSDDARWCLVRGKHAGMTVTYFRTAVHELGHALGLRHNNADNGVMNTTEVIAENSLKTPETPFPSNISWSFAADDEHRLRHWPDIVVRPGGASNADGPIASLKSDSHKLNVTPLLPTTPLGAPVRINVALRNVTNTSVDAPSTLSLHSGFVRGHVIDPTGTSRTFSALVINENEDAMQILAPGEQVEDSLTLLHGGQGALFPEPGSYRIVVEVTWRGRAADPANRIDLIVSGETNVVVNPAVDSAHEEAAASAHHARCIAGAGSRRRSFKRGNWGDP